MSAWCDNSSDLLGVGSNLDGTGAMDGAAKTTVMLGVCTSGAAILADAYTVTVNGVVYGDWFLPSKGELIQLNANVGFDCCAFYWSSSEYGASAAWGQISTAAGLNYIRFKSSDARVRPVRAF